MSEWRVIARHALTLLVGQFAVMAFGVVDTVIAGRYSPQALAVLSVASSIFISTHVALNGLVQALLPVWAELHGANQPLRLGRSVRQAVYIMLAASAAGMALLWHPDPWLRWSQVPPALWPEIKQYLDILAVSMLPSLLFRMYGTLNQSLGLPRLVTALQVAALMVKVPLSVLLTFGWGDVAGLGVVGCAWATLTVNTGMALTAVWMLRHSPIYRPYRLWQRLERPEPAQLRRFARLGVPAALTIGVEVTSFTLMSLLIARLGSVASASHQIAASMAAMCYMMPLALGIAASARTGYWIGAGDRRRARQSIVQGLVMAAGLALITALAMALGRHRLASWFTADAAVAAAAAVWLGWVALYHLADALQAVCTFLLRCFGITLAPLLINVGMLWGVGLWGGYLLAYQGIGPWAAQSDVASFWRMATLALAIVSVCFLLMLWRTVRRWRH